MKGRRFQGIWSPFGLSFAVAVVLSIGPGGVSSGLGAPLPEFVQARVDVGHDANLLDASDADRAAFASRDPGSFFVVSAMSDEFLEGALAARWRLEGRSRPSLEIRMEHRQYLYNPIRSAERFALEGRVRAAGGARLDLGIAFTPQEYERHRLDRSALPGEPEFRPEVQRRGDVDLGLLQALGKRTDLKLGLEGSVRDDRAPFDARDRLVLGASAGLVELAGERLRLGVIGGFRRTQSRNAPDLPTDLSNREWTARPSLEARALPLISSLRLDVELGWRHYTSRDPADKTHYGRDDRRVELDVSMTRALWGGVVGESRFVRRWWRSDIPANAIDDDAFSDTEARVGLVWSWARERSDW